MSLLALILSLAVMALTWFAGAQKLYWLILGVAALILAVIGLKKQKSVVAVIALLFSLIGAGYPGFLVYLESGHDAKSPEEVFSDGSGSPLDDIESGFGDEEEPPPAE